MKPSDRAAAHRAPAFRSFTLTDVECRDDGTGAGVTFEGVASVVDIPYTVRDQWGEFSETICAGAFNKTLRDSKADVALYINHRHMDVPMASTRAGTMQLTADPNLRVKASLDPARSDVVIARSAVQRGELPQMSIGFRVPRDPRKDVWNADATERSIRELMLDEVSIVRQGANTLTEASMRSFHELMRSLTDVEMTKADMRRAVFALERRFADVFDSTIEQELCCELNETFGGPDAWVCLVDHTDTVAVFQVCSMMGGMGDTMQVGYTADSDGNVTLSTDAPVNVHAKVTYVVEPPEPDDTMTMMDRSAANPFAERDRELRYQLDRMSVCP